MESVEPKEGEIQEPLEILVVDDEPEIASIIKDIFEGHAVTTFGSAEQALDELRKRKEEGSSFDWVITDFRLPNMNGFELAKKIMEEKLGKPYVTMLTAMTPAVEEYNSPAQLKEKGVDTLVGKAFKSEVFLNLVSKVRQFRAQSENPHKE